MDIGGGIMLKVYDKNGNYIRGIVDYKDARIEQELNITDTLLFRIPKPISDIFEEEGYVETKEDGRFVIKEKNLTNDGYEIVGKYDLEELLEWVESESYVTMNIIDMFDDLLEGTEWTAKYGDEWGRNLLKDSQKKILLPSPNNSEVSFIDDYYKAQAPNVWKDLSGNGNDGELMNFDFTEDSGWVDGGLKFDGVDDYIQLPELNLDLNNFTLQVDNKIRVFNGDKVITENMEDIAYTWKQF